MSEKIKIAGVITEFNPFHKGHKYLFEKIRQQGFTHIVCVMSPNFVQRGDIAIVDKFARAKTAILNGADLIIEMPTPFALSCGEKFAKCGVHLLSSLGCVDTLFFGSESGDLQKIEKIAFSQESEKFKLLIQAGIKQGKSYPRAYSEAFSQIFEDNILTPNNILGAEYIKAIKQLNSKMKYKTIERVGVSHDSSKPNGDIASASAVRQLIYGGNFESARKYYFDNLSSKDIHFIKDDVFLALLRVKDKEYFNTLSDCENGLGDKIYSSIKNAKTFEDVILSTKSKCHTRAKICRILLSAILQIDKEKTKTLPDYIRILGFNRKGSEILSLSKESKKGDILISSSLKKIEQHSETSNNLVKCEIMATDIYNLLCENVKPCSTEYTNKIVIIND